jgi:hypothetical protein
MRSMDSLIVSIAIAITLGLAACGKDSDNGADPPPDEETSKLGPPGGLERPPTDGKVPESLRPPR